MLRVQRAWRPQALVLLRVGVVAGVGHRLWRPSVTQHRQLLLQLLGRRLLLLLGWAIDCRWGWQLLRTRAGRSRIRRRFFEPWRRHGAQHQAKGSGRTKNWAQSEEAELDSRLPLRLGTPQPCWSSAKGRQTRRCDNHKCTGKEEARGRLRRGENRVPATGLKNLVQIRSELICNNNTQLHNHCWSCGLVDSHKWADRGLGILMSTLYEPYNIRPRTELEASSNGHGTVLTVHAIYNLTIDAYFFQFH